MRTLGVVALMLATASPVAAGSVLHATAVTATDVRAWEPQIAEMLRNGELAPRRAVQDSLLPGREHRRLQQFYRGVPVWAGEIVVQSEADRTVSVFGDVYTDIGIETTPTLTQRDVEGILTGMGAETFGSEGAATLTVFQTEDGRYVLVYRVRAWRDADLRMLFVDAHTGQIVHEYSDLQAQAAGLGTGVLGDRKKLSVRQNGAVYVADDGLRPPAIRTYDFRGDIFKLLQLKSVKGLMLSDLASDADNDWTDGADVDAHAYLAWTYDFLFKRFNRRGLDNHNMPIQGITHAAKREDMLKSPNIQYVTVLYMNAFYMGDGVMVFGEGLPDDYRDSRGRKWNYLAAALDVVAHELTHGVTDYTSRLIYEKESGALNECFSDVIGTSAERFFQSPGSGLRQADYVMGEDAIAGGSRSMANPQAFGDPDHYSKRYLGTADGGGVHTNSAIGNHAYFLAIEGGTNATSRLSVTGVGDAHRDQIEKAFFRAFTELLPPNATYSMARAATLQAARDLYGAGSAAERALAEAWTAVGVN